MKSGREDSCTEVRDHVRCGDVIGRDGAGDAGSDDETGRSSFSRDDAASVDAEYSVINGKRFTGPTGKSGTDGTVAGGGLKEGERDCNGESGAS